MLAGAACRLLEQIQMLSPVNRVAMRDRRSRIVLRMRGRRPSREYQDDQRSARTTANLNARLSGSLPCLPLTTRVSMSTSNFTDRNLERCVNCVTLARNRRSPIQPHSFSSQMSAWDETGPGLFAAPLTTYLPGA